jgi:uncharacterized protein (TIGR02145 family)
LPADATNQTVTWSSSNSAVVTVVDGTLTAIAVGVANITATTEDGNLTAYTSVAVVATQSGCNTNTPRWGQSLGAVSFHTNQEWLIEGNGISQTWSNAVTAVNCQKTTFSGGIAGDFDADCRSNPDFPGDFFSWCAIVRFADQLCPYPWRVPTIEDFIDLYIAMGGSGLTRTNNTDFVLQNYITRWGGAFGGFNVGWMGPGGQGSESVYWSMTEHDGSAARTLEFGTNGTINFTGQSQKSGGFTLRCVR